MRIIPVPAPHASAFNKQRPPSDLLLSQLKYFQHLDRKHDHGIAPEVTADVGTEAGAARFIAAMTTSIRTRALAQGKGTRYAGSRRAALEIVPERPRNKRAAGLQIAAAEEPKPLSTAAPRKSKSLSAAPADRKRRKG